MVAGASPSMSKSAVEDRHILMEFYAAYGGHEGKWCPGNRATGQPGPGFVDTCEMEIACGNWAIDTPLHELGRIRCNDEGRVAELSFYFLDIDRPFPSMLRRLPYLKKLDLHCCRLEKYKAEFEAAIPGIEVSA